MPTVGYVAGFMILMYFRDHAPPHFHVQGNGVFAKINLDGLTVEDVKGTLKASDLRAIRDWARRHLPELYAAWTLAQRGEAPEKIKE